MSAIDDVLAGIRAHAEDVRVGACPVSDRDVLDVEAAMAKIRAHHALNQRLNDAGITYNVWTSIAWGCHRCGSAFQGHLCHVVGSPSEAHALAQPAPPPAQGVLW